ncbi:polysaccharide biosynthesis tyrosine autokinase [Rubrivivax gelatinosus]|uniref:Tyrosine protein kinase n=1 Tax=Rubrivivax gelatinosus TaxID=28068 RepID=A0ABS1DSD0_RUBGE|nr:polysaccharide biosynthesis tyrosine autokinase [Rubrivivax gelatinosus]MBK1712495.1 tyrosine protein kinase [Rubrivivax gelatinosus]
MAKFRDSAVEDLPFASLSAAAGAEAPEVDVDEVVHDRAIGELMRESCQLPPEAVERTLAYQRQHGVRFGEAAVALGLVTRDDVLYALSRQFHYPVAPQDERRLGSELVVLNEPFSPQSESFRALRSQLLMRLFNDAEPRRALAVISPDAGDGKTYTAANVAVALAQLGGRTLLIDADLRGPRQHELFKLENRAGLSGILSGRSDSHVIKQIPGVSSLFVLPVGATPPNPLELVERPAFGLLMRELTAKFDHVVVDTPAAVHGADASVIAGRCGAALLIARQHRARVDDLSDLAGAIVGSAVRMVGIVVNEY